MQRFHYSGFSFIELITVVALIAIITSAATPVASSLFQRHREMVLREHLITLRKAISNFHQNMYDDDADGEIDEDARGDANHDGYPGIRRVDDDGDLYEDEDWRNRSPVISSGKFNLEFDWNVRRDDDEDGICDEEAFASDLDDLTRKVPLLHKTIPEDPTLRIPSWDTILMIKDVPGGKLVANNDLDWYDGAAGGFVSGDPIVISTNNTYESVADKVLTTDAPTEGATLYPLTDEDPRNRMDDDGDGRIDEDAPDMLDIRSLNSARGLNLTSYNEW